MPRSTANARKVKAPPQRRNADDWLHKGLKYDKAGDNQKAMKCYLEAFNLDPRNIEALKQLSRKLVHLTERRLAIEVLERAIESNPEDWEVYLILGNLALEMRMLDAALKLFGLVCQMRPQDPSGPNNVATVLREMERFDDAISVLQEAIPKHQTSPALWNTLATVVSVRDGLEQALPFYEEALRLNPKLAPAWSNVARTYEACGRFDDALEAGRKAISLDPQFAEPHFVLGTSLLCKGELAEGLEHYEWRQHWRRTGALRYTLQCERWDGEPLDDKTLVVCSEQGLGDELLFASCLPDMAPRVAKLCIGCDPRLVPLYERSFPGAAVGGHRDMFHNASRYRDLPFLRQQGITPDRYIDVGSLLKFLRRDIADFPERRDGYLVPDPERVAFWRQEMDRMGPGPKVGITWASGFRNTERNQHYSSLDQWGGILNIEGATFVNVQHGDCEADIRAAEAAFGRTIHIPQGINLKDDLDDLAALIRALDVVIAPTVAAACMAMAVGTELWLFARRPPFWHFGRNAAGDSSPIGKTRLFLHDTEKGWEGTMNTIGEALRELV